MSDKRALIESLRDRPVAFNSAILGRGDLWSRQKEIARSVVRYPSTLVATGNMVGKTHLAASLILWFLFTRPGSIVLVTAPSQTQLETVLWGSVEGAYRGSRVPLGGRLLRSPLKIDLGNGWYALGHSTTDVERLSGHHAAELFVVVDEASGVSDPVFEALRSCGPSRELLISNPLRPSGTFHDRCQRAEESPLVNVIQIDSREGPHAELDRSPWGLADRGWLDSVRQDYGEGGLWWACHVEGRFPGDSFDAVVPGAWVEAAVRTIHKRAGPTRTAIDLALGHGGGDMAVVITRDDNGVLACEADNLWSLETIALKAATQVRELGVEHHRVSWDFEGIGADFDARLQAVGIKGARPYQSGKSGGKAYFNLRAAAAWKFRQRLDPNRMVATRSGVMVPQVPFSLMRVTGKSLDLLRKDLRELRYGLGPRGEIQLEKSEIYAKRLGRSPDHQSAICQSWAFDLAAPPADPPTPAAPSVGWPFG